MADRVGGLGLVLNEGRAVFDSIMSKISCTMHSGIKLYIGRSSTENVSPNPIESPHDVFPAVVPICRMLLTDQLQQSAYTVEDGFFPLARS